MIKKIKKYSKISEFRCSQCFITFDRLIKDKICSYLIKIINENGDEKYICKVCFQGW